jgi:hypothetical protein
MNLGYLGLRNGPKAQGVQLLQDQWAPQLSGTMEMDGVPGNQIPTLLLGSIKVMTILCGLHVCSSTFLLSQCEEPSYLSPHTLMPPSVLTAWVLVLCDSHLEVFICSDV